MKTGQPVIANRPGGYDEHLVSFLQPLLVSCGILMDAYQNEQRRKETEGAHRESEARLQSILDNTTAVMYVKDTQGRYVLPWSSINSAVG